MRFACILRIKSTGECLLNDGQFGAREQAAIRQKPIVEYTALRMFGPQWRDYAEVVEIEWQEWMDYVTVQMLKGSKGSKGKKRTTTERRRLRRLAKLPRPTVYRLPSRKKKRGPQPVKRPRGRPNIVYKWWTHPEGRIAVCARRRGEANRHVRRVDRTIRRGDLAKGWIDTKPHPDLPDEFGVFTRPDQEWKQVL